MGENVSGPPTSRFRLSVKGFKSFRDRSDLELANLTVLAGANSSGKSSILQAVLLIKQTLDASYDPGPLLLDGPHVKFTSADQVLWKGAEDSSSKSFDVEFGLWDRKSIGFIFEREKAGFRLAGNTYGVGDNRVTFRPGMTTADLREEGTKLYQWIFEASPRRDPEKIQTWIRTLRDSEWSMQPNRCHLDLLIRSPSPLHPIYPPARVELMGLLPPLMHIPGYRGHRERSYPVTGRGPSFQGPFHEYTASVIAGLEVGDRIQLNRALERLGLTWKVEARPIEATRIELLVGRLPKTGKGNPAVNIADVGFGVSEVLPVLTALVAAKPGQTVFVEQPETHLHPRAQVALAEVIGRAVAHGVRVIVETHSDLLLTAFQRLVARGEVTPEKVLLHWFQRDEEGATTIRSTPLDESGAFGDWPVDFADVSMELDRTYTEAAHEQLPRAREGS